MSVLAELDLSEARGLLHLARDARGGVAPGDATSDAILRAAIAGAVWDWWRANRDRVVRLGFRLLLRVLILRRPVRWHDLHDVLVELFGPETPPPAAEERAA